MADRAARDVGRPVAEDLRVSAGCVSASAPKAANSFRRRTYLLNLGPELIQYQVQWHTHPPLTPVSVARTQDAHSARFGYIGHVSQPRPCWRTIKRDCGPTSISGIQFHMPWLIAMSCNVHAFKCNLGWSPFFLLLLGLSVAGEQWG